MASGYRILASQMKKSTKMMRTGSLEKKTAASVQNLKRNRARKIRPSQWEDSMLFLLTTMSLKMMKAVEIGLCTISGTDGYESCIAGHDAEGAGSVVQHKL